MGYFYSVPEIVLGTVPARGERRRLDTLIAQFKVLPESEVLRTPAVRNVNTAHAREKPGMFFQTASYLGYIKTTTPPSPSRVSPKPKLQPPPQIMPQFSHFCPIFAKT